METVLAATVAGAFALVGTIYSGRQAKGAKRAAEGARADMSTNHGLRPGEYLEMVGELRGLHEVTAGQLNALTTLMADHTVADAVNFELLDKRITAIQEALPRTN